MSVAVVRPLLGLGHLALAVQLICQNTELGAAADRYGFCCFLKAGGRQRLLLMCASHAPKSPAPELCRDCSGAPDTEQVVFSRWATGWWDI